MVKSTVRSNSGPNFILARLLFFISYNPTYENKKCLSCNALYLTVIL